MTFRSMLAYTLGAALLLGLNGCGTAPTASPSGSTSEPSGASARKVKIGVSIPSATHGWTGGVVWWVQQTKGLYPNVEWVVATADKPESQVSDIETMLASGVDGLVVLAMESAPLTPIAKKASERGVYVVNVDRGFTEPVADVFLEGDNAAFGRKAAEFMAKKLGGTGKILVLRGIPSTVDTARFEAFTSALKATPGIQLLDAQAGEWNQEKSYKVTQTMLLKHPQVDAVWAADDDMALGAEKALKEAGRTNVWMVGGGGMKTVVKRVKEGDPVFPATVTYPPSMIAAGMHVAASALTAGKDRVAQFMPRRLVMDVELVTSDNADRYYFPDSVY
jgi:ribose transport system substrate-binding protein